MASAYQVVNMSRAKKPWRDASSLTNFWVLLYIATFVVLLPVFFSHCNHSIYFTLRRHLMDPNPYIRHLEHEDRVRLENAQQFFNSFNQERLKSSSKYVSTKEHKADVVIAVTTAARKTPPGQSYKAKFVTQTVGKLLSQLSDPATMADFPYSIKMILCNGGEDPHSNDVAIQLAKYVELVTISGKSPAQTLVQKYENEKVDYKMCLKESLKYSSRYILVLEDDVIANNNTWTLLKYAITAKLENQQGRKQVAFVKMFHPECKLWYFSPGLPHKLEILGLSICFGTLLTLIHDAIKRNWYPKIKLSCLTMLAWCVYVSLVVLAIGRPCMVDIRHFFAPHLYTVVPNSPNGYLQALLFTTDSARSLVDHLNNTSITPQERITDMVNHPHRKSTLIEHMPLVKNMTAYQVFPNAFMHIGYQTTGPVRDPFCVY